MNRKELEGVFNYTMNFKGKSKEEIDRARSVLELIAKGKATINSKGVITSSSQGRKEVQDIRNKINKIRNTEFDKAIKHYLENDFYFRSEGWRFSEMPRNYFFQEACFYSALENKEAVSNVRKEVVELQKESEDDFYTVAELIGDGCGYPYLLGKQKSKDNPLINISGDRTQVVDPNVLKNNITNLLNVTAGIYLIEGNEETAKNLLKREFILKEVILKRHERYSDISRESEERFSSDDKYRKQTLRLANWDPNETYFDDILSECVEEKSEKLKGQIKKSTAEYREVIERLDSRKKLDEIFIEGAKIK